MAQHRGPKRPFVWRFNTIVTPHSASTNAVAWPIPLPASATATSFPLMLIAGFLHHDERMFTPDELWSIDHRKSQSLP